MSWFGWAGGAFGFAAGLEPAVPLWLIHMLVGGKTPEVVLLHGLAMWLTATYITGSTAINIGSVADGLAGGSAAPPFPLGGLTPPVMARSLVFVV